MKTSDRCTTARKKKVIGVEGETYGEGDRPQYSGQVGTVAHHNFLYLHRPLSGPLARVRVRSGLRVSLLFLL